MKKLFKMSTTCRWGSTFINRAVKKAFAFCSKHPEIPFDTLGRAFKFANGSAICSEEYFATSCGEFIRSSSDVQFNNIRCCITYVHELFKETSYILEFYLDEDFELNCKVGRAIFRRFCDTPEDTKDTPEDTKDTPEDTKDTPEDTKDTPEDTKDTPEDTTPFAPYYFPMSCLAFKLSSSPVDTAKKCHNCANLYTCDSPNPFALNDNFQILPAWVYSQYNINPVLTVALTLLYMSLHGEFGEKIPPYETVIPYYSLFLTEEMPF